MRPSTHIFRHRTMRRARRLLLVAGLSLPILTARADDQLIRNPEFDEPVVREDAAEIIPKWWFTFSSLQQADPEILLTREPAMSGDQSVRFAPQRIADAYQGLGQAIEVAPDIFYQFSVHVQVAHEDRIRGTVKGQLSIEWIDKFDNEVKRTWGPVWTSSLLPGEWHKFEMTAQAPVDAVGAVFVVTHFDAEDGREGGTFHVDHASVTSLRLPEDEP